MQRSSRGADSSKRSARHAAGAWLRRRLRRAAARRRAGAGDRTVYLAGDGIGITPRDYAALLAELCRRGRGRARTTYLLGGEVERFERHWATAARQGDGGLHAVGHAGQPAGAARAGRHQAPRDRARDEPHLQRHRRRLPDAVGPDADAARRRARATFTRADVEAVLARTAGGRVATDVGAIAIESPIRRLSGQMFDWDEMTAHRGAGPRARHRHAPRRRAAVHRLGLHRPHPGGVRGAVRHGLRVAVEVLQLRHRRDPRRAAPRCSTACSTPGGCSAATWPWAGRRRWSRGTTWTASRSG